jgi:hypothetical protein
MKRIVMSKVDEAFRQRDCERLIKATAVGGVRIDRFGIMRNGRIIVHSASEPLAKTPPELASVDKVSGVEG